MDQFNEKKRSTQEPETVDEKLQQEVLEKYSKEEAVAAGGGWHGRVTAVLALLMACFHIYTSGTGLFGNHDAAFHPPLFLSWRWLS